MKKKPFILVAIMVFMLFTLGQSAMAYSDVTEDPNAEHIKSLQEKGVISGHGKEDFKPNGKLTYASAVTMLVNGFDLNIDNIHFIKQPKATDNFPNLKDNAWYSQAFVIAHLNGLDIPTTVKANDYITKEQLAHHLFQAIAKKGDYAFIKIYMAMNDESKVNPHYMNNIQKLLISKIATLDKKNNFNPKHAIKRGEAASWIYGGIKFVEDNEPIKPQPEFPGSNFKLETVALTSEVNKVTITAQLPSPGYGLHISSITFDGDKAVLHVATTTPDPNKMYPQVISEVKISTFVDSKYKVVLTGTTPSSDSSIKNEALLK
ncbi:S-layer homology domain-containing protein [Paenibacillus sp. L3-i20]|uniref:S-layer homology domain-containing protein n=1 Tax=Paenibacillus sp. L3-i20 TaxID=2905833 RepID=UPI001EDD56C5|nr:S-layer homology domain-containing protein [Paenibacillus sp. L3-i20]GKU78407.1 hypothetical protein L3i20_v228040 [Paenibacillus sp. L3-i20]